MVYHPEESESGLYTFEPEMFLIPPMEGFLRRVLGARWGLILVCAPDHINRADILDFLANFALQQDYYSEFSADLGDFENLEKKKRRLRTLEEAVDDAVDVMNEIGEKDRGLTAPDGNFSRNSDLVFIDHLTPENVPGVVEQAMGGRLAIAGMDADGSFPALKNFLELLASPHLAAASLMGIIGLNTVAGICPDCKVRIEIDPTETEMLLLGKTPEMLVLHTGKGCETCNYTGVTGRILIHEAFEISEKVRTGIRDGMALRQLRILAKREGMRTLLDAAWDLVDAGLTSIEEVSRIADITDPESEKPTEV